MQTQIIKVYIALIFLITFSTAGNAAPGDLDLSFNGTGKVTTDVSPGNNVANATAIQADGKIVVTGTASNGSISVLSLVRYNADGTLDTSLDGDGILLTAVGTTSVVSYGLTIQPDGKIIVVGFGVNNNGTSNCLLLRHNPNGSLDTTFSGDGIAPCNIGIYRTNNIALQADGKIIIGGVSNGNTSFAVQRINADGSPDTTFGSGTNGLVLIDFGSFIIEEANGVAVRPDGKIAVAGYVQTGTLQYDFAVAVLNASGTPDTSFDTDGKVQTSAGGLSQANSVAVQSDNKIIAAGFAPDSSGDFALARYNTDGSLDTSFDADGIVTTPFLDGEEIQSVKIASDGKIIAAGYTNGGSGIFSFAIARYNPNGSLDATFSDDGKQTVDFGAGGEFGNSLAIDQSGRYVVAGGANNLFAVTRVLGDSAASVRTRFDFDGDGKADVSVFRSDNASWYIQGSQNGFTGTAFGISTDKLVPSDYDGDGKTDLAVYRGGTWYIQRSSLGFTGVQFGNADDIPVPADFDGDGKADIAVFRPSNATWYLLQSSSGFTGIQFGISTDKPVPADYDGDGKTDLAVNRSGTWYINGSQRGFYAVTFGTASDKLVPADYDGDGKADVAVFRPSNGTWYLQQSTAGFTGIQFGQNGDAPVAADYDGDGKADVAVFRGGTWYLNRSTAGFAGVNFGSANDLAIPNAFVR